MLVELRCIGFSRYLSGGGRGGERGGEESHHIPLDIFLLQASPVSTEIGDNSRSQKFM